MQQQTTTPTEQTDAAPYGLVETAQRLREVKQATRRFLARWAAETTGTEPHEHMARPGSRRLDG